MKKRTDAGLSHAEAMQRHACRAMWERHGMVMTGREYLDLCVVILMGRVQPVMRDDRGALVYPVHHRGTDLYAIWSHEHARIRTLLPCKAWVGRRWKGRRLVANPVKELRTA
jgi:hypothetical protein